MTILMLLACLAAAPAPKSGLDHFVAVVAARAPRLASTLAEPARPEDLEATAKALGRPVPPELVALYKRHDGQRPGHAQPLFFESYFIPLRGLDSVEREIAKRGTDVFVFGKDFGGSFHAVALNKAEGRPVIFFDEDNGARVVAPSLEVFLEKLATELERGQRKLDDRFERKSTFVLEGAGATAMNARIRHADLDV